MKKVWVVLKYTVIVVLTLILAANVSGNQFIVKGVWSTYLHGFKTASIGDARFFDTRKIEAGELNTPLDISASYNEKKLSDTLLTTLELSESVAFLVMKDDQILQEHYWDGYSDTSHSNSFSMAKSIVTMLAQIAIQNGYLDGWNQKVTDIFPDLTGEYVDELELWHLSTMSAGMDWNEHYTNAFGITAQAYYGPDVWELIKELPIVEKPGQKFVYQSGSSQLLGMVLIKATGRHLSDLASEWLWKPMGANHDAKWHTDQFMGTELAYCCFNSNARDFARFGKLMINKGNWNGKQILDSSFVEMASHSALAPEYGYSFWIDSSHGTHVFYQRGVLGQYIISIPEYDLVVVRLGHHRLKKTDAHSLDYHVIVEECINLFGEKSDEI